MTVGGRAAYGPSGAPPRVPRPSRGGGGLPLPGGEASGPTSPWPASGIPRAGGGIGVRGGVSRRGSPSPPFGPLVLFSGGCGGWLEGPGPGPPYGRQCSAARPSLQRVRPGLFGVPGRRARPGGLAAGGSVPFATPAHAPCGWPGVGGGEGDGGGAPRAAGPHSPPALLPATGRRAVVWAFAHRPPAPRVAAASSRGTGWGGRGVRRALGVAARVSG